MRNAILIVACLSLSLLGVGCGPTAGQAEKIPVSKVDEGAVKPDDKPTTPVEVKPDYAGQWSKLLEEVETHLAAKQVAEVETVLEKLKQVYPESEPASDERTAQLTELTQKLAATRKQIDDEFRAQKLASAQELLETGKLAEATTALGEMLAHSPTAKERETARQLQAEIETQRKARRDLQAWMQMLGSANRTEVATAQSQLSKHPETALGMMLETATGTEKPLLVANALEMLRLLDRPEATIPALLAVLKRTEQRKNWPDAMRELGLVGRPGAGQPLLELALSATDPEQQIVALTALAQVTDPPPNTFVALLPLVERDGQALPAVLQAANHAVRLHGQNDLTTRRGFDFELSEKDDERLAALPARLKGLMAAGQTPEGAAAAQAAQVLALVTGQLAPAPLAGIKISRAEAESPEGPAAGVLDGVWNTVDLKNMWRYPADRRGTILLDLGASRTVSGVRIWNFNEAGGAQRGWKEVEVFVSESPAEPTPVALGVVPQAPGAANTPDYGTQIGVPHVRGRYVRLQAKSLWQTDGYSGLAEIQVLGF